jgi:hypothetical protein
MAKFIKFNIQNSGNGLDATSGFRYVDVKDIESVTDVIGGGPGYAVQIVLKGLASFAPGHANDATVPPDTVGGRVLTLAVQTSVAIAAGANSADPAAITVAGNMPSQAILKAMSANPGGVAASAQLGRDGAGLTANAQMYWNSFTIANAVVLPAAS